MIERYSSVSKVLWSEKINIEWLYLDMFKFFRKERRNYVTYKELLILSPCCDSEIIQSISEELKNAPKPLYLLNKEVPANLNMITFGQLDDLGRLDDNEEPFAKTVKIVMGIDDPALYEVSIYDAFGFMNFIRSELERINELFSSIKTSYSSEEISAGIKEINFGTFGMADWYAKRMGISDQDEVYKIAWVRIYTCMKNDNEMSEFERRLSNQYSKKRH